MDLPPAMTHRSILSHLGLGSWERLHTPPSSISFSGGDPASGLLDCLRCVKIIAETSERLEGKQTKKKAPNFTDKTKWNKLHSFHLNSLPRGSF